MKKIDGEAPAKGMSLRTHIATETMTAMISCQSFMNDVAKVVGSKEAARDRVAWEACKFTDALIAELNKEHDDGTT